jgi:hypothetical protein
LPGLFGRGGSGLWSPTALVAAHTTHPPFTIVDLTRWDEKAGPRRDAIGTQVIDALEAQKIEIKETGNEEKLAPRGHMRWSEKRKVKMLK